MSKIPKCEGHKRYINENRNVIYYEELPIEHFGEYVDFKCKECGYVLTINIFTKSGVEFMKLFEQVNDESNAEESSGSL